MSNNVVEQYLIEKGLEYKLVNGQFNIKYSPISGEYKWHHFYIGVDNGLWDDKKTGMSGNFDQFRAYWGDEPCVLPVYGETSYQSKPREYTVLDFAQVREQQAKLWALEPKLVEYLKVNRGLTEETIKHFKVGAVQGGHISIPIFSEDDILTNIRKRKNPFVDTEGPRYFTEAGCKSILFNEVIFKGMPKEVYITEGEFDAMCLWQRGLTNVVSVTLGAGYFSKEWAEKFQDVKKVNIVFDNDDAGIEGAKKVAELIGQDKCRIVSLPKPAGEHKIDLTDYFVKHGGTRDSFLKLVKEAKMPSSFDSEAIKHISDFNDELRNRLFQGEYKGISTGYEALDDVLGGYRKGRLIIVSGLTSVGKTTFSSNLTMSLAYRNVPGIFISMEMPPIDISKKFLMLHKRIQGKDIQKVDATSPLVATIEEGLKEFKGDDKTEGMPIYLFNGVGEVSLRGVLDVCRVAKESYGVEYIVIDHLHYFSSNGQNRTTEVGAAVRAIKNMAMELDMPILLLAHLNRGGRSVQRRGMYVPTLSDLRDSGAIEQDADQVIFVCRDSEASNEDEKRKSIIKVAKNRDGSTGYVSMDFDMGIGLFTEVEGVDYMEAMENGMPPLRKGGKKIKGTLDNQPAVDF